MKYMLAVDYDRTLFQNGEISRKTLDMIDKFRAEGNLFGIVSGRDYVTGYKTFKKENKFPFDFLLLKTGAMACDKNGEIIYEAEADGTVIRNGKTLVPALFERAFELGAEFCTTSVGKERAYYYKDFPNGIQYEKNGSYADLPPGADQLYRRPHPHSELESIKSFGLVSVIGKDEETTADIAKVIRDEFGDVLNPLQNTVAIDISPAGIDKAYGIKKYAEIYGIGYDDIYVAGDNYNDIAMLEAYNSCAMTGGVDDAKKAASCVYDTVGDYIEAILKK